MNPTPTTDGGPGIIAFVAFTFLALALWFLMRDMTGRMRRMSYRERDRLAALEESDGPTGSTTSPDVEPGPDSGQAPLDGQATRE